METRFYVTLLISIFLCQAGCSNDAQVAESSPQASAADPLSTSEKEPQEMAPIIIDVRSQEEWDAGHLEQAIFIPHEDLPEKIAGVTEDKSAKLVLY